MLRNVLQLELASFQIGFNLVKIGAKKLEFNLGDINVLAKMCLFHKNYDHPS